MSATLDVIRGSRDRRNGKKRRRGGMEPIEMRERRHGYFPKAFVWRGQRYDVYADERCWTISRRGGRVEQHCFRVRCGSGLAQDRREGTYEVYQDVQHNTWHVRR